MSEAKPHISLAVQRRYHRQSRRDAVQAHVPFPVFFAPQPADETGFVEPGLIYVDYSLAISEERQQLQGILLSLDFHFDRVGIRVELLAGLEAEIEIAPQRRSHLLRADVIPCILSYLIHDYFAIG